jgi:DNA-binding MarR family transcriptional regulator
LYGTPGLSQTELARVIRMERMTAGVHVKRCVDRGLVAREAVPGDRRRYALVLTSKGRKTLGDIRRRLPLHERQLVLRLSTEERHLLVELLDKVGHD